MIFREMMKQPVFYIYNFFFKQRKYKLEELTGQKKILSIHQESKQGLSIQVRNLKKVWVWVGLIMWVPGPWIS